MIKVMNLFELNLNSSFSTKDDKEQIEFSCESLAILSLIDYCDLKINRDFKCFFNFYSTTFDEKTVIDILNLKFTNYTFISDKFEYKNDQNLIFVRQIDKNQNNANDTNLPSLTRQLNDHLKITITGLASVFRNIVKESQKLLPNSKINYLLVYLHIFNLLLFDDSKRLNKKGL